MMTKTKFSSQPGRRREFDTEGALDKSIKRFSEYGFHGTSISDLNTCMELSSGSIYKAWGDKRGLFLAALDRYMLLRREAINDALKNKHSGREKIEALFTQYLLLSSEAEGRTGCLIIETAVELSQSDNEINALIDAQQRRRESQLCQILVEGQRDGSIRADLNAANMSKVILALQQGMRVLGKTGAEIEDMSGVVSEFMRLLE